MAQKYERLVQEDLNVGTDEAWVCCPGSGQLRSTQIGVHSVGRGQKAWEATWAPGAVAAGSYVSTTMTVTTAYVRDHVMVSHDKILTSALRISGHVTARDVVTVVIHNPTADAITVPSGTVRAVVFEQCALEATAGAAPNPVDQGVDVTFTPTVTGGVQPYTYLWDFGDALPTVNTTDLYGYWPLDEASGNPRASTLGAAPDLAEDGGAVSEVAGRFTNAMTNTEIYPGPALQATLTPAVGISTGLTVAFWFKMPAWVVSSAKTLFSLRNAGTEPYLIVYRYYDSDFLDVGFRYGANYLTLPLPRLGDFSEDVWHLLVVRYDATTGKLEGMVDDGCFSSATDWTALPLPAEKLSATVPPALLATFNAITFDTLTVGKAFNGNFVNGGCALDDLRIWNRALTAAEIADLWYRSDEEIPTYNYGDDGVQTVTVTATSTSGCVATDTVDVTVNASTLDVSIEWSDGAVPSVVTVVTFTPTVTPGVAPYTYDWSFGDGSAHSTDEIPTHTFDDPLTGGSYTVTLIVTDAAMATATDSLVIDIAGL